MPSTSTEQAPHCDSPQPNFGPRSSRSSRKHVEQRSVRRRLGRVALPVDCDLDRHPNCSFAGRKTYGWLLIRSLVWARPRRHRVATPFAATAGAIRSGSRGRMPLRVEPSEDLRERVDELLDAFALELARRRRRSRPRRRRVRRAGRVRPRRPTPAAARRPRGPGRPGSSPRASSRSSRGRAALRRRACRGSSGPSSRSTPTGSAAWSRRGRRVVPSDRRRRRACTAGRRAWRWRSRGGLSGSRGRARRGDDRSRSRPARRRSWRRSGRCSGRRRRRRGARGRARTPRSPAGGGSSEKIKVTLIERPRAVISSIAATPASVAGILTSRFGRAIARATSRPRRSWPPCRGPGWGRPRSRRSRRAPAVRSQTGRRRSQASATSRITSSRKRLLGVAVGGVADLRVVRVALSERLLEDGRVRRHADDRVLVDRARERAGLEQVAREEVDPDALPQRGELLRGASPRHPPRPPLSATSGSCAWMRFLSPASTSSLWPTVRAPTRPPLWP